MKNIALAVVPLAVVAALPLLVLLRSGGEVVETGLVRCPGNLSGQCAANLTVTAVKDALVGHGYTCTDVKERGHHECKLKIGVAEFTVYIDYNGDGVRELEAAVTFYQDGITPGKSSTALLSWVASLPFADSRQNIEEVTAWVAAKMTSPGDAEARIGPYIYHLERGTAGILDLSIIPDYKAKATKTKPRAVTLPAVTGEFPTLADAYLRDLTTANLTKLMSDAKWTCAPEAPSSLVQPAQQQVSCQAPAMAELRLTVGYDDESRIRSIYAWCHYQPGTPLCRTLFRTLAAAAHLGHPDLREQSAEWAARNVDHDAMTVIGDVRFIAALDPTTITILPSLL
ncbi:hypothetical protein [Catellatospora chokoriensis]|nr:hypothetical protein [Catellatospora chokoriensis]